MLTSYFESTGFDFQTGLSLKIHHQGVYDGYGMWTKPIKPMSGIGDKNTNSINTNMPVDEASRLIAEINLQNAQSNKRVADLTNFISVTASQVLTGATTFVATNAIWHDPLINIGFSFILGVTDGMAFSKFVERPVRQMIDAIRKPIQEKNTRRFLDSEGIR